jgi:hypothetical protein
VSFLTQGKPTAVNKSYGRKPYIRGQIGDYTEMMDTVSRKSIEDQVESPRSQLDKPYLSYDYADQEYTQPLPGTFDPTIPNNDFIPHTVKRDTSKYAEGKIGSDYRVIPPDYCCACMAVRALKGIEEPISQADSDKYLTAGVMITRFDLNDEFQYKNSGYGIPEAFYRSLRAVINGKVVSKQGYYPDINSSAPFRIWPNGGCWKAGDKIIVYLAANVSTPTGGPYKGGEEITFSAKRETVVSCDSKSVGYGEAESQKGICCTSCNHPQSFGIDDTGPVEMECGDNKQFFLSGGVPPFTVSVTPSANYTIHGGSGLDAEVASFTTCRDEIWAHCITETCGTEGTLSITDSCGQNIAVTLDCTSDCCEGLPDGPLAFDDASTPDTIAKNSGITVYVTGGCGPFTFATSSLGYSFTDGVETENRNATLNCADGTCGSDYAVTCALTVTDSCDTVVTATIRNTEGDWDEIDSCSWSIAGSNMRAASSCSGLMQLLLTETIISGDTKWTVGSIWMGMYSISSYSGGCASPTYPPAGYSNDPWVYAQYWGKVCSGYKLPSPCTAADGLYVPLSWKSYKWVC